MMADRSQTKQRPTSRYAALSLWKGENVTKHVTLNQIVLIVALALVPLQVHAQPKNIILFIGDGMGPEQIKAAGRFENGVPGALSFEQLGEKPCHDV